MRTLLAILTAISVFALTISSQILVLAIAQVSGEASTRNDDREAASPPEMALRTAWEQKPTEERAVQELTLFYTNRRQFHQALKVLRDYVSRVGATALGYCLQGELLFAQREYNLAAESLDRSLELSKDNHRAHMFLGLMHALQHRNGEALEELKLAAQQQPGSAQARYYYGRILYTTGNYPGARDEFLACLKLQPIYPRAHENLALAYEALQEYPMAIQAYERAVELDKAGKVPPAEDPYIDYGSFTAKQGDIDRAVSMLME
ncbi:MAG: tetratricopeptide repeat protein, partial [Acidobacteria bacterium]|nr:tetratricopeptide repeat protein [Acidobacteriota bacterium]